MDAKKVFCSILENDQKYETLQFNEIKNSKQDEILLLIIKQVFFYSGQKFKCKKIKEKMKKHEWLKQFIGGIITTFLMEKNLPIIYGFVIKYFCDDFDNMKKDFIHFIKEIEKMKSSINLDLFEAAICFMCYLNGNNKYSDIISYLKQNNNIKLLEIYYDNELIKKTLYQVITEYCIIYKYPIILDKEYDKKDITKEKIIGQMKVFQCYAELCPITKKYKDFILSLCSCLKNCEDLRKKREKNVSEFIEEIFIMLHLHLKISDYWEDNNILIITNDIYNAAFQYSTENFDENYIDFVISYITYYKIPAEDFLNIFLKGLDKDEFNKTFKNLQLNETPGSINDKITITGLLNKIYKKKMKDAKSFNNVINGKNIDNNDCSKLKIDGSSIGLIQEKQNKIILPSQQVEEKNENNIKETNINKIDDKKTKTDEITNHEENKDIKREIIIKKESEFSINKIFQKNENNLNEKNEPEDNKDFQKVSYEDFLNFKKEMEKKIKLQNEKIKLQNEKLEDFQKQNMKQDIEIEKLKSKLKLVNLDLERISFRDLTKRVLNNMINFVNKKNSKLLKGLSKRKDKLNKINMSFDFKDVEFMKKPFQEICDRYYHSNSRSHVPDIAKSLKNQPVGLCSDPAGIILNKYYEVMIESKQEGVLNFLINTLNLKSEINSLYL